MTRSNTQDQAQHHHYKSVAAPCQASDTNTVITAADNKQIRHDWQKDEAVALLSHSLGDLIFRAQSVHRCYFNPNSIQLSTLINIKQGGCPEDCAYCPQSARYHTGVSSEAMLSFDTLKSYALKAKQQGTRRLCLGAAWRQLQDKHIDIIVDMIAYVHSLGLESCVTLGMLRYDQAVRLKQAGLDFYNHNLDSSAAFYKKIISTREYTDRLETLNNVRAAGINLCCGGIIGMGEDIEDRAELLLTLANMPRHPESVPINRLIQIEGTPLEKDAKCYIDPFDFVKMIAAARVMLPKSYIRLSAGREQMNDQLQALCFLAGANSIFYGEKLLTAENPDVARDQSLLQRLGMSATHQQVL